MKHTRTPATDLPAERKCPRCGALLDGFGPEGLCGVCMLDVGMETEAADATLELPGSGSGRFGDYELIEEVARGGMGVIFKARQLSLQRHVAVKMILGGQFASEAERARFRAEAETAARLQHPNIVAIHEVGERDGQPFFTMDYVEGQNLAQLVGTTPLPAARAATYLKTITEAVHFAHQQGVLHRDLKPSNVLIDSNDEPRVTDFGLAKRLEGDASLTTTGQMLGSPSFMPPEQAGGRQGVPGPASDVYSLGAMLYFLLTARAPFVANSVPATLRLVEETEPVSPRLLNASVPRDLEIICLKCLDKDARRRYQTAQKLAEELGRFLRDEPIHARPAGFSEKLWRWSRRHRALATVATALVFTLVVGTIALTIALRQSRESEKQAVNSLRDAMLGEAHSQRISGRIGQHFEVVERLRRVAGMRLDSEVRDELSAALANVDLRLERKWQVRQRTSLDRIFFSPDLKLYAVDRPVSGFEIRSSHDQRVVRQFPRDQDSSLVAATFSPDSQSVAVLFHDGDVEVWDVEAPTPTLTFAGGPKLPTVGGFRYYAAADFSPIEDAIALAPPGEGLWLESLTGAGRRVLDDAGGGALFLKFDPSGSRLAVQRLQALEIWDVTRRVRLWSQELELAGPGIAWSPDGQLVAVVSGRNSELLLYDGAGGKLVQRLVGHRRAPWIWEFHPDGQLLASVSHDQTLRLWDVRSGQQLLQSEANPMALQFSRDGERLIASPQQGELGIYELAVSDVFREWRSTRQSFDLHGGLAQSADGRFLLSAALSQLYIWDERAQAQVGSVALPMSGHASVFFGRNDREILYSCGGRVFRRSFSWSEENGPASVEIGEEEVIAQGRLISAGFDARSWLVSKDKLIELWPEGRPKEARVVVDEKYQPDFVATTPDGRWGVHANYPGRALTVWDGQTGQKRRKLEGEFGAAWFSPDGQWLVGCDSSGYQFWEVGTWKPGPRIPAQLVGGSEGMIAFSHLGRQAAVRVNQDTFHIIRLPEGTELVRLEPAFQLDPRAIAMSEDGASLRILGAGHRVFEWDLASLRTELSDRIGLDVDLTEGKSRRVAPAAIPAAPLPNQPITGAPFEPAAIRATLKNVTPEAALRTFDRVMKSLLGVKNHRDIERLFTEVLASDAVTDELKAELLLRRADFHWRLDRGTEAIADMRKVIELDSANETNVFTLTAMFAATGDAVGYEEQRRDILNRLAATTDTFVARRVGKICLMLPMEGEKLAGIVRLTEVKTDEETRWSRIGRALAEYRAGRFESAREWAAKASVSGKPESLLAQCCFVEALAHRGLGQWDKAGSAMEKGIQIMQANAQWHRDLRLGAEWGWGGDWGHWVLATVLMNEARSLIEVK